MNQEQILDILKKVAVVAAIAGGKILLDELNKVEAKFENGPADLKLVTKD